MSSDRPEIWQVADEIQMDLRAALAKLTELRSMMAALDLTDRRPSCPVCGYRASMNLPSVAEHFVAAHGGLSEAHSI